MAVVSSGIGLGEISINLKSIIGKTGVATRDYVSLERSISARSEVTGVIITSDGFLTCKVHMDHLQGEALDRRLRRVHDIIVNMCEHKADPNRNGASRNKTSSAPQAFVNRPQAVRT